MEDNSSDLKDPLQERVRELEDRFDFFKTGLFFYGAISLCGVAIAIWPDLVSVIGFIGVAALCIWGRHQDHI